MKELINTVVEARAKATEAKKARHDAQVAWEESNAILFQAEAVASGECASAEAKLKEEALKVYAEVGNKTVAPGVGIRLMTRLLYENKEAMDWAVKHELALKLDTSAFEKIAKTSNLPFVTITEEPIATIATELQAVDEEPSLQVNTR